LTERAEDAVAIEGPRRLDALAGRSRGVAELTKAEIDQMIAGRMSSDHDELNALLDTE
jgi:hypothetical protein